MVVQVNINDTVQSVQELMQMKGMASLVYRGDLIKKEDTFAKKRIMANDKLIAMKGAMEG